MTPVVFALMSFPLLTRQMRIILWPKRPSANIISIRDAFSNGARLRLISFRSRIAPVAGFSLSLKSKNSLKSLKEMLKRLKSIFCRLRNHSLKLKRKIRQSLSHKLTNRIWHKVNNSLKQTRNNLKRQKLGSLSKRNPKMIRLKRKRLQKLSLMKDFRTQYHLILFSHLNSQKMIQIQKTRKLQRLNNNLKLK